jgi:hypothetical protein
MYFLYHHVACFNIILTEVHEFIDFDKEFSLLFKWPQLPSLVKLWCQEQSNQDLSCLALIFSLAKYLNLFTVLLLQCVSQK